MPTATFTGCDCCPGVEVPPEEGYVVIPGGCCVGGEVTPFSNRVVTFTGVANWTPADPQWANSCAAHGGDCDDWNNTAFEINNDGPCTFTNADLGLSCGATLQLNLGGTGTICGTGFIELQAGQAWFCYPIPADCRIPSTIDMTLEYTDYSGLELCNWNSATAQVTFTQ